MPSPSSQQNIDARTWQQRLFGARLVAIVVIAVVALLLTVTSSARGETIDEPTGGSFVTMLALGDATVDLGTSDGTATYFARLLPGTITAKLKKGTIAPRVRVFVPARLPELTYTLKQLPTITVNGIEQRIEKIEDAARLNDPETGIELITVFDSQQRQNKIVATNTSIEVASNDHTRAVVMSGAPENLGLGDARSKPRTISAIRAWYSPGAPNINSATAADGLPGGWIGPALISVSMVILAGYWVVSGHVGSRRREYTQRTRNDKSGRKGA